jgi:hypothetical protein
MEAFAAEAVSTTSIFTTCSENCLKISGVALTACARTWLGSATVAQTKNSAAVLLFIDEP